nr:MAG TPA: FeoB-associated Cys-rich membrane protein [Microviridae sp.]
MSLDSLVFSGLVFLIGLPLLAIPWLLVIWLVRKLFFSKKDGE